MKNKKGFISKIVLLVLCGFFVIIAFSGCDNQNTDCEALVSNAPRIAIYEESKGPFSHGLIRNDEMFTLRMTDLGRLDFALTDYTSGKITFRDEDYSYDKISLWLSDDADDSNPIKTFTAQSAGNKEITVGYFHEMTYPLTFKMNFCDCGDFFNSVMRVGTELESKYIDIFAEQLQELFDELNADIDISDYEFEVDEFLYMKGGVRLRKIQVFYCSHCKNVVGYTIDGVQNPEEVYDLIPQYTIEQWENNVILPTLNKYLSYGLDNFEISDLSYSTQDPVISYSKIMESYYVYFPVFYTLKTQDESGESKVEHYRIDIGYMLYE